MEKDVAISFSVKKTVSLLPELPFNIFLTSINML